MFRKTKRADKGTAEEEVCKFLDDPEISLQSLNLFPFVKQLVMKYNTTFPSGAPVGRLFTAKSPVLI